MIKIYLLYEYYIYIFLFEISLEFNFFFVQRRSKNWEKKVCEILHSREIDRARRLIENHPCRVSRRVIPISVYIFFLFFLWDWEKAERKEISAGIDESVTRRCKVFDIEVAMGMKGMVRGGTSALWNQIRVTA